MPLERHDFGVVQRDGAVGDGGARDRECEPGVVGLRVVVHVRAGEPVAVEGREIASIASSIAMRWWRLPMRSPPVRSYIQSALPSTRREPSVDAAAARQHRDEEREHAHEVRRVLEHPLAFGQPLVDQAKLALVEVAEPAVHELRAPRAGARREVVAFHERGAQPAAGGVERDARAGDAAPDDEQVEVGGAQSPQRVAALEARAIEAG